MLTGSAVYCRVAASPYPAYSSVGPVSAAPPGNFYLLHKSKKPALKAGFSECGSSDWTRTSSTSPVITAFVKYSHIFTNIFTIIIVFLW
ncbi:TPA: hypothetical protein ACPHJK_001950 [Enterobacter cloacae]